MPTALKHETKQTLKEWRRDPFRRRGATLAASAFFVVAAAAVWKHWSVRREASARATVLAQGIRVRTATAKLSAPERSVVLTGELKPYESVTLYVSSGAPLAAVPDVKGYTQADAEHALAGAKFTAKIVGRFDKAPKGSVLAVQPAGGQQAPEGSAVTLIVSKGEAPSRVPQLVGLSLDAARAQLDKLGLKLNVDQQTPNDMIPRDTIASQAVPVDTSVDRGTTIGVAVSSGPMLTTVPDVGGKPAADAGAAIEAAGFVSRVQYVVDASNASGNVVAQDPAAGTTAARRSPVTISIAVPGTVPDVSALGLDDARRALTRSGYAVGPVQVTTDGTGGKVTRTDPPANAVLRPGETVTIYYNPSGGH